MTAPTDPFVWDTTGPAYAEAAGHLDWLLEAAGPERRHLMPSVVRDELHDLDLAPDLGAFDVVDCDEFTAVEEIVAIAELARVLGADLRAGHNRGEVFVAHVAARTPGSVAIIDDRNAVRTLQRARRRDVHGVLWAIARGVVEGRVPTPNAYSGLCDAMLTVSHSKLRRLRWPVEVGEFRQWFDEHVADLDV